MGKQNVIYSYSKKLYTKDYVYSGVPFIQNGRRGKTNLWSEALEQNSAFRMGGEVQGLTKGEHKETWVVVCILIGI